MGGGGEVGGGSIPFWDLSLNSEFGHDNIRNKQTFVIGISRIFFSGKENLPGADTLSILTNLAFWSGGREVSARYTNYGETHGL